MRTMCCLGQRSLTFLAPGTSLMEDNLMEDNGDYREWFQGETITLIMHLISIITPLCNAP